MIRRGAPFPRNSNSVFIEGFVDLTDPTNADGSPKWIDDATGTWEIRDDFYPAGSVIASGSVIALGSGAGYRCDIADTVPITAGTDYVFRVRLTSQTGYVVECQDQWEAIERTGRTPTT